MFTPRFRVSVCGAVLGSLMLCGASARAQTAEAPVVAPELQTADIPLRNVNASLMAYWLDPAHQAMPQTLRSSLSNGGSWTSFVDKLTRQPGNALGPRDLKLPDGVMELINIDRQNVLHARGTAAGLEALKKLVAQIDVPLQQTEIEAQFWDVALADVATLPLRFRGIFQPQDFKNGVVRTQTAVDTPTSIEPTTRALDALRQQNRAHLVTAPRVTVTSGLTAALTSTTTAPFVLDKAAGQRFKAQQDAEEAERRKLRAQRGLAEYETLTLDGVQATASDNWDPGIVFVQEELSLKVASVTRGDLVAMSFQLTNDGTIAQASTIVRDGQTLAMRLPVSKAGRVTRSY